MLRIFVALVALCLAVPAAAQSANDFQLPANPSPSATPRVQGPVDEEAGPVPVRPRVVATPAATPAPTLQPVVTGTPGPSAVPSAAAAPRQPSPTNAPAANRAEPVPPPASPALAAPASGSSPGALASPASAPPQRLPGLAPAPTPEPIPAAETGTIPWPWLLGGLLLGGALVGAAAWLRTRRAARPPAEIERPKVAMPAAGPAPAPAEALLLKAEALRVTRSFAFATVDYRLTLINRSQHALSQIDVGADVVSAHAQAPVDSQLAGPGTVLEVRHRVERLGPGQSQQLEGQVRLPLSGAPVIFQGKVPLLVPLLRVRVAREGSAEGALSKTLVVGQAAPGGGRVQPFNLEDTPRAYTAVAQRELA